LDVAEDDPSRRLEGADEQADLAADRVDEALALRELVI
jgi:hypothetical protein